MPPKPAPQRPAPIQTGAPAAAAAASSSLIDQARRTPPPSPTPSPDAEDIKEGRDGDTFTARRARNNNNDAEVVLLPGDLSPGPQPQYRKYINDERNRAIAASAKPIPWHRRASQYRDPVLRITENRELTYAQQHAALRRLALDQDIAAEERSALTKTAAKRKSDKLAKRKAAREHCGSPKPHKRRGPSPPPPSDRPTPRAEYSTVGLGLLVKA